MTKKIKYLKDSIINSLLNKEEMKEFTAYIISDLLKIPFKDVYKNLKIESNRINNNINLKNSITDNMYSLEKDLVNIEVNYNFTVESQNKNVRYMCQLLLNQVKVGDRDICKKVHQININAFDIFGEEDFLYKSTLRDEKYNKVRNELIEIYDINMKKLKI